jgi:hypothetical protein
MDNAGAMDIHSIIYDPGKAAAPSDVTQGDNMLFAQPNGGSELVPGYSPTLAAWQALPGFDRASGMGVLTFTDLANVLISRLTPTPLTPAPDPTAVVPDLECPGRGRSPRRPEPDKHGRAHGALRDSASACVAARAALDPSPRLGMPRQPPRNH